MLNTDEMDSEIISAILQNKEWPDNDEGYAKIRAMTFDEAWESYLTWHGILGYADSLKRVFKNLEKAESINNPKIDRTFQERARKHFGIDKATPPSEG